MLVGIGGEVASLSGTNTSGALCYHTAPELFAAAVTLITSSVGSSLLRKTPAGPQTQRL